MRGVTTRRETIECQRRLEDVLTNGLSQKSDLRVGYLGGGNPIHTVNHNGSVWFCSKKLSNRFWNVFGLQPIEGIQNDIVVEINPPLGWRKNHQCAGMFAIDQKNSTFLLHNGKIGGGRPGIGKTAFCEWYSQFSLMMDIEIGRNKIDEYILVGNVSDDDNFLDDLEIFISRVRFFKSIATGQAIDINELAECSNLKKTGRGADRPRRRETIISTYNRDHRITQLAKLMAGGKCRLCKKRAPFMDRVGSPFLETHHVKWLSRGGKDSIDNTVALCPNCHRKMHHVDDKDDRAKLREIGKEQVREIRRLLR